MRIPRVLGKCLGAIMVIGAAAGLAGCNVYLHSDSFEKQASQVKDDFGKIAVLSVFTKQQERLANFASKEDQAVAVYNTSFRDLLVADILHPTRAGGTEQVKERLLEQIDSELKYILGAAVPTDEQLQAIADLPEFDRINKQSSRRGIEQAYGQAVRDYNARREKGDDWPTDCTSVLAKGEPTIPTRPSETERLRSFLYSHCLNLHQMDVYDIYTAINVEGVLGVTIQRAKDLEKVREDNRTKADEIRSQLKQLGLPTSPDPLEKKLTTDVQKLRGLLQNAEGLAAQVGWKQIACTIDDLLRNELTVPVETGAQNSASSGSVASESRTAAAASSATSTSDSVRTNDCGTGSGTNSVRTAEDASAKKANQQKGSTLMKIVFASADFHDTYASQTALEHVNSLLVARAQVLHQLHVATMQVDRDDDKLKIARAEVMSLARQLGHLRKAKGYAQKIPTGSGLAEIRRHDEIGMALAEWVAGRNEGQIVWRILRMKEYQIERSYANKLAATTADDFKNLLKPALDELDAYGKGGIAPATIANAATALGVIGIAAK